MSKPTPTTHERRGVVFDHPLTKKRKPDQIVFNDSHKGAKFVPVGISHYAFQFKKSPLENPV